MAREDSFRINAEDVRRYNMMKNCFKCKIEFKVGDFITRVKVRLKKSSRTRIYHKTCWDKVLQ